MKRLALLLCGLAWAYGQPAFDVVSIRPPVPAGQSDVQAPGFGDLLGATYRFPDRVRFRAATVAQLLQQAYDMKPFQISGPGWMSTERFDIAVCIPEHLQGVRVRPGAATGEGEDAAGHDLGGSHRAATDGELNRTPRERVPARHT